MRSIVVGAVGEADVLTVGQVDLPDLGDDECRVAVEVVGLNFWDVMQRRGDVPLPASRIPGVEGAGTVVEVGPSVTDLAPGDRVAWSKVQGSCAEQVQGPAQWFIRLPDELPATVAAGGLMQGTTAWYLARQSVDLTPGDTAVVFAAAGGVGHLLTQLLVGAGQEVVAVVGDPAKASIPVEYGARAVVVDSADPDDLVAAVRRAVPAGAAAVFDANGGPDALRDLGMLRARGMVVYYGTAAGPLPTLDLAALTAGSLAVRRTRGPDFLGHPADWRAAATAIIDSLSSGRLRVRVDSTLPLAECALAHRRLESRQSAGKILLTVT